MCFESRTPRMDNPIASSESAERHVSSMSDGVVKAIFCLLGVGILLPWNAFVSAKPYFEARLCSSSSYAADGSDSDVNVELWFGFLYNLSSVLSLASIILIQWYKDHMSTQRRTSIQAVSTSSHVNDNENNNDSNDQGETKREENYWMIVLPLVVYLLVFVLTTILVLIPQVPPTLFRYITYIGLAVCGVCTAFASAGIVGTAGMFPAHVAIHPYFSGQAIGGLIVSCANFATACLQDPSSFRQTYCSQQQQQDSVTTRNDATSLRTMATPTSCIPYHDIDWASFTYFLLASVVLAACIVGYAYIDRYQRALQSSTFSSYEPLQVADTSDPGTIELHDQEVEQECCGRIDAGNDTWSKTSGSEPNGNDNNDDVDDSTVLSVLHAVKAPAFAVFVVFFVTLALFPGWTSQLKSVHECTSHLRLLNDLYTPLTFVIFNGADLAGRLLAGYISVNPITNTKLVALSLCRLLFFPLFLLCLGRDSIIVAAIPDDLYSLLVQVTFGVGNGLVTTLCFVQAPTLVSPTSAHAQTRASEILNFSLSMGLLSGSIFSFVVSQVGTGHW